MTQLSADVSPARMANAIRALAMDAVQAANSGHPGMPMGMADIAVALWKHHLRHNPANPLWPDRDRFVLSNGHGSMLQYALLHLTGYDLPIKELEHFRQLHSKTPGHPELGITPGVETTTGPLGQGFANAVGLALAEKLLAAEFNRPDHRIVDHCTYVFMGDGCMMEGVSHEVASLAGTWKLGKLVAFYDRNGISIDGEVKGWFTDDTALRFKAYGWNVIDDVDGHDVEAVNVAINRALDQPKGEERPTLICCDTVIGRGAPHREGTAKAHGEALGVEEVAAARKELGWNEPPFVIPKEIYGAWDARADGAALEKKWDERLAAYRKSHPDEAAELLRRVHGERPATWPQTIAKLVATTVEKRETIATRKASAAAIAAYVDALPEMLGGSADLTGSNNTDWKGMVTVQAGNAGRYLHYGVREFGMIAIMNGIALHGGYLPFGGTFLTFSDYCRNAVRMAALMKLRNIFVFTHDSIGLGEDGPTHQSVEHAASLRLIPHLDVWRPADTTETAIAWAAAIERNTKDNRGPTALLLSRQNLPYLEKSERQIAQIRRGAYVLAQFPESAPSPQVVLIATGSEVGLAVDAAKALAEQKISVRVVSMPSTTVFDRQAVDYKASVLPAGIPRVAIEAGVTDFWWKYVRAEGAVIGIDTFGESAPGPEVFEYFGFTVANVVATARKICNDRKRK